MMKTAILALLLVLIPFQAHSFIGSIVSAGQQVGASVSVLTGEDPRSSLILSSAAGAAGLSGDELNAYYRDEKLSLFAPAAKSLFIGFGSGPSSIGDDKGEVIGAWGNGIGLGTIFLGGAVIGTDWIAERIGAGITHAGGTAPPYEMGNLGEFGIRIAVTGGAIMLASRVIESLRVITWGWRYNRELRRTLDHTSEISLSLLPDPSGAVQLSLHAGIN